MIFSSKKVSDTYCRSIKNACSINMKLQAMLPSQLPHPICVFYRYASSTTTVENAMQFEVSRLRNETCYIV